MVNYEPTVNKGVNGREYVRNTPIDGVAYGDIVLTGGYEFRGREIYVEANCVCGKKFMVRRYSLKCGKTKSCGCLSKGLKLLAATKHNLAAHPLYFAWFSIKKRCYSPKFTQYANYGGRGISVCQEWFDSLMSFYNWAIDNGWKKGLTLDRIDVNGDYEPSNCRWITIVEQQKNKRTSVFLTAFGETKIHADWGRDERCKVSVRTFNKRLKNGWTPEDALTKTVVA